MTAAYIYLLIAVIAETISTTALKAAEGFTRPWPSLVVVIGYGVAFYFFSLTLRVIPVGVSYAIWSGLGIILISLLGWLVYEQMLDLPAIIGIALIICGILVMNLFSDALNR